MQNFSNILKGNLKKEDIFISEIAAHMILSPSFYDFLYEERNRYIMNDLDFINMFKLDIKNYDIVLEKDAIYNDICIEQDWIFMKEVFECLKYFGSSKSIIVTQDRLIIDDNKIFKLLNTDITYNFSYQNYSKFFQNIINHLYNHLKPAYTSYLTTFLDSITDYSYNSLVSNTLSELGIKIDFLPKLYYNNILIFLSDIVLYEPAFRDYDIFYSVYKDLLYKYAYTNMLKEIKELNISDIINIEEYYTVIKNEIKKIGYCNFNKVFKTDNDKNIYYYMTCPEYTIKIKINNNLYYLLELFIE